MTILITADAVHFLENIGAIPSRIIVVYSPLYNRDDDFEDDGHVF